MSIKLFGDQYGGLDELAKAVPAAIQGFYDAEDRNMKKKELAAKLLAEQSKTQRQKAKDILDLEKQGYEVPAGAEDPLGLLQQGMLTKSKGFLEKQNTEKALKEAQIKFYGGRAYKQDIDTRLKENELTEAMQPKPTEGEKVVDREAAKDYNEFALAGGMTELDSSIKKLENAIERIKKEKPSRLAGATPEGVLRSNLFPEATAIQQQIEGVIQGSLRQTLGPQFTEKEGQMILQRMYNPSLSYEENYKRAKEELDKLKARADVRKKSMQYFEEKGTMKGFRGASGSGAPAASSKVTVTNGKETFQIDASDLQDAMKDGFREVN